MSFRLNQDISASFHPIVDLFFCLKALVKYQTYITRMKFHLQFHPLKSSVKDTAASKNVGDVCNARGLGNFRRTLFTNQHLLCLKYCWWVTSTRGGAAYLAITQSHFHGWHHWCVDGWWEVPPSRPLANAHEPATLDVPLKAYTVFQCQCSVSTPMWCFSTNAMCQHQCE